MGPHNTREHTRENLLFSLLFSLIFSLQQVETVMETGIVNGGSANRYWRSPSTAKSRRRRRNQSLKSFEALRLSLAPLSSKTFCEINLFPVRSSSIQTALFWWAEYKMFWIDERERDTGEKEKRERRGRELSLKDQIWKWKIPERMRSAACASRGGEMKLWTLLSHPVVAKGHKSTSTCCAWRSGKTCACRVAQRIQGLSCAPFAGRSFQSSQDR